MAEMVRWCEAHGSDWYRAWCGAIEMARREGHRVDDFVPCRPVEGVWSLPGELIDPAKVDYAAACKAFFADWRENDITDTEDYERAIRAAVDAALGWGEPSTKKGRTP
jgi:hypothetical protein